jgi:hypothetical protein
MKIPFWGEWLHSSSPDVHCRTCIDKITNCSACGTGSEKHHIYRLNGEKSHFMQLLSNSAVNHLPMR